MDANLMRAVKLLEKLTKRKVIFEFVEQSVIFKVDDDFSNAKPTHEAHHAKFQDTKGNVYEVLFQVVRDAIWNMAIQINGKNDFGKIERLGHQNLIGMLNTIADIIANLHEVEVVDEVTINKNYFGEKINITIARLRRDLGLVYDIGIHGDYIVIR